MPKSDGLEELVGEAEGVPLEQCADSNFDVAVDGIVDSTQVDVAKKCQLRIFLQTRKLIICKFSVHIIYQSGKFWIVGIFYRSHVLWY